VSGPGGLTAQGAYLITVEERRLYLPLVLRSRQVSYRRRPLCTVTTGRGGGVFLRRDPLAASPAKDL
jgi:hypothetical protein